MNIHQHETRLPSLAIALQALQIHALSIFQGPGLIQPVFRSLVVGALLRVFKKWDAQGFLHMRFIHGAQGPQLSSPKCRPSVRELKGLVPK